VFRRALSFSRSLLRVIDGHYTIHWQGAFIHTFFSHQLDGEDAEKAEEKG